MEDKDSYTPQEVEEMFNSYVELVNYRQNILEQTIGDAKNKSLEMEAFLQEKAEKAIPEEIKKKINKLDKIIFSI
ncbi:hypothetical protein HOD29_03730 [archaeon]|jgi:hypothetical protein|nr:hypothetical protein [archaeon]